MSQSDKKPIISRLNRIAGQVNGIAKMIEEDRYCIDVLHQVQAIKAALSRAEDEILKDHAASCVESAIQSGDPNDQRRKFNELVALMGKFKQ